MPNPFTSRHEECRLPVNIRNSTTEDHGHEESLERRGDCCRARDRRTGFRTAFGPGSGRADHYRPRRLSPGGVRALLFAPQCAGRVYRSARCGALGNAPFANYDVPCDPAAVTVVRRARLNISPTGEARLDCRPPVARACAARSWRAYAFRPDALSPRRGGCPACGGWRRDRRCRSLCVGRTGSESPMILCARGFRVAGRAV